MLYCYFGHTNFDRASTVGMKAVCLLWCPARLLKLQPKERRWNFPLHNYNSNNRHVG